MAEPLGVNSNYYYPELAAEWPKIYNLKAESYTENGENIYTGESIPAFSNSFFLTCSISFISETDK